MGRCSQQLLQAPRAECSRLAAERLLQADGRDGAFLLRRSETVPGAYGLCLLFQKELYTYRVLPDEDGSLGVQGAVGLRPKRYQRLVDLVEGYKQPNQGLVYHLLYPIMVSTQEHELSDEQEQQVPPVPPRPTGANAQPLAVSLHPQRLRLHDKLCTISRDSSLGLSSTLTSSLVEYADNGLTSDLELARSGRPMSRLRALLAPAAHNLHSEAEMFLKLLECLQRACEAPRSPCLHKRAQSGAELEDLVSKLSSISDLLCSIEHKVLAAANGERAAILIPRPMDSSYTTAVFEVKLEGNLTLGKRLFLSVDVMGGRLGLHRKAQDENAMYTHDRILQVIKSRTSHNKLSIMFDKDKEKANRKDFLFENPRKREAFCQLLQQMKSRHSKQDEPDMLSLFIGTWNMGSAAPPRGLTSWLTSRGLGRVRDESTATLPHDIYVLGAQENAQGERDWVESLRTAIRNITHMEFKEVAVHSLWSIKLVVFVRAEHAHRISHVCYSSVRTGIANALGNKGAVGISFMFNGTSFCFVNCHLTSGGEKAARRNQNYFDIVRTLSLGDKKLLNVDLTCRFTHLFWFGDLNYRLNMDVTEVLDMLQGGEFEQLFTADQLALERATAHIFNNFQEEEVTFPPTYRYERGTRDNYVYQKFKTSGIRINVPSWCDRVLWKSYPEVHIACTSYGCPDDILTSDHSPVFATFDVAVTSQFVSKKEPGSAGQVCIDLEAAEAVLKTTSRAGFYLEIFSSCLEKMEKGEVSMAQVCDNTSFRQVKWKSCHLPQLKPMISDIEYLEEQHMLLSVKANDSYESYGECCVALRAVAAEGSCPFSVLLSHHGEETGNMRGRLALTGASGERRPTRSRIYDWIHVEKEEDTPTKTKKLHVDIQPHTLTSDQPTFYSGSPSDQLLAAPPPQCLGTSPTSSTLQLIRGPLPSPPSSAITPIHCAADSSADTWGEIIDNPLYASTGNLKTQTDVRSQCEGKVQGGRGQTNIKDQKEFQVQIDVRGQGIGEVRSQAESRFKEPRGPCEVRTEKDVRGHRDAKEIRSQRDVGEHVQKGRRTGPDPPPTVSSTEASMGIRPVRGPQGHISNMTNALRLFQGHETRSSQLQPQSPFHPQVPPRPAPRSVVLGGPANRGLNSNALTSPNHPVPPTVSPPPVHRGGSPYGAEPPLPPKSRRDGGQQDQPSSIKQWLATLGLPQYENMLLNSGWESLQYLSDLSDEDLIDVGIQSAWHRGIILDNLPRSLHPK
uniref:phosphatidylinositol-3,4,5-trisphosphate 5-phosphatase n=2 Tax=Eptatretus burgeri TaxID=7764 RepID=A0A8C4NGV9_EPTBU